jgi:hypothetical protein
MLAARIVGEQTAEVIHRDAHTGGVKIPLRIEPRAYRFR